MKSIKTKIVIYLGVLLLIVCVGFAGVSYMTSSKALIAKVNDTLPQLAAQTAKVISSRVEGQFNTLELLAENEKLRDMTIPPNSKLPMLNEETQRSKSLRLGIADKNGILVSTNSKSVDISSTDYFKQAMSGNRVVTSPIVDKSTGSVELVYAVPIKNNGETVGVLVDIKDGYILCDLIKDITFGKSGKAFMINKDCTTIAHSNRDLVKAMDNDLENVKKDPKLKSLVALEKQMTEGKSGVGGYEYEGTVKYLGFAPVEGTEWSVAITAPEKEVLSELDTLKSSLAVVTIIFLLVSIVIGYMIAKIIADPIINLSEHLRTISTGDFTKSITPKFIKLKDEIGILAQSMDKMQKTIGELIKSVVEEASNVSHSVELSVSNINGLNSQIEEVSATT